MHVVIANVLHFQDVARWHWRSLLTRRGVCLSSALRSLILNPKNFNSEIFQFLFYIPPRSFNLISSLQNPGCLIWQFFEVSRLASWLRKNFQLDVTGFCVNFFQVYFMFLLLRLDAHFKEMGVQKLMRLHRVWIRVVLSVLCQIQPLQLHIPFS